MEGKERLGNGLENYKYMGVFILWYCLCAIRGNPTSLNAAFSHCIAFLDNFMYSVGRHGVLLSNAPEY